MPDEDFRLADHARSQAHDSRLKIAGMTDERICAPCQDRLGKYLVAAGLRAGSCRQIFAPRDDLQLA